MVDNPEQSSQDKSNEITELDKYVFFSNPVSVGITLYNGMQLILKKISLIDEKLDKLFEQKEKKDENIK